MKLANSGKIIMKIVIIQKIITLINLSIKISIKKSDYTVLLLIICGENNVIYIFEVFLLFSHIYL